MSNEMKIRNGINVGGDQNDDSAAVQIDSTTRGMLIPRMTSAQIAAIGTPANGLQVYDIDLDKLQIFNGTSFISVGAGGGTGINHIENSDAEGGTTGYAVFDDGAVTIPVDGAGVGSPTLTFTQTSSEPLRGDASFLITHTAADEQGNGVANDFTIDDADKNMVMAISFDYEVASGTYVDGDLITYIYDVTNAALIEPVSIEIENTTVENNYRASFQTTDSTSYRLILMMTKTTTDAFTMKMDNVFVGPQDTAIASRTVSARMSGDPVNASANTPIKFPTTDFDSHAAYNNGTGLYTCPSGGTYMIHGYVDGPTSNIAFVMARNGTSEGRIGRSDQNGNTAFSGILDCVANDTIALECLSTIDIGGTSILNIQRLGGSADAQESRVVAMTTSGDAPNAVTAGDPIIWPSTKFDTHGAYNTTTGLYTCPVAGFYNVSGAVGTASPAASIQVTQNATDQNFSGQTDSNGEGTFSEVLKCIAGDTINLEFSQNNVNVGATSTMAIFRLSGPTAIAASETIAANFSGDDGSIGAAAILILPDTNFDTHGAYNAATGVYTVPIGGIYRVYGALASVNSTINMYIYVDGVLTRFLGKTAASGEVTLSSSVQVTAGQLITVRPDGTLDVAGDSNISIERVK